MVYQDIPMKIQQSELFSLVAGSPYADGCPAKSQLFGGVVVRSVNETLASNELCMVWTFLCRLAK